MNPVRASFTTPLPNKTVRCSLCPRQCEIPEGERGFCRTRFNRNGRGYTLAYGNPCVVNLDPVERLAFLHVLPGSRFLSVATAGCTFHCAFCENWAFSQAAPEEVYTHDLPPRSVVERALALGAQGVAYAYVEPAVFFEYMRDTAREAKDAGLINVAHTNGYIRAEPLRGLCSDLDAVQVDLKSFDDTFYRELCQGRLEPVLATLKTLRAERVHVEITNLVIPGRNDAPEGIRAMCDWIVEYLGPETPLHFARFYPLYRLTRLSPTPVPTLERARSAARACGLRYVYIANVPDHEAWHTVCPACGTRVIQRKGYVVEEAHVRKGCCTFCGRELPGVWK
ncbi:MAG: AmmeMemoRadiSam system radical SAM enzyme [Desulfobacteraceae bacterium]